MSGSSEQKTLKQRFRFGFRWCCCYILCYHWGLLLLPLPELEWSNWARYQRPIPNKTTKYSSTNPKKRKQIEIQTLLKQMIWPGYVTGVRQTRQVIREATSTFHFSFCLQLYLLLMRTMTRMTFMMRTITMMITMTMMTLMMTTMTLVQKIKRNALANFATFPIGPWSALLLLLSHFLLMFTIFLRVEHQQLGEILLLQWEEILLLQWEEILPQSFGGNAPSTST